MIHPTNTAANVDKIAAGKEYNATSLQQAQLDLLSKNQMLVRNLHKFQNFMSSVKINANQSNSLFSNAQKHSFLKNLFIHQNAYFRMESYILFNKVEEANSPMDKKVSNSQICGTAFNLKDGLFYYWKKFDRISYMEKLEAYYIMKNSEHIFNYSHLIHEKDSVYVFFKFHFGDLHTHVKEKRKLSEQEAQQIFKQCVTAVQECHDNGIIVRHLKLKKFVFTNQEKTKVALIDLEDCHVIDKNSQTDFIKCQQGCPAYISPEVLNPSQDNYSGRLSDAWSLGIILFTLLVGRYPFHHQIITIMFAKIIRGKLQIPPDSGLSPDARILLYSLIRVEPGERLLPAEILATNWLRSVKSSHSENFRKTSQLIMTQISSPSSSFRQGSSEYQSITSNDATILPIKRVRSDDNNDCETTNEDDDDDGDGDSDENSENSVNKSQHMNKRFKKANEIDQIV